MPILNSVLNDPVFYSISITLLHFIWQGVIIAFGLHLFLKLVPSQHSGIRYLASLVAMALNVVVPLVTFFLVHLSELAAEKVVSTANSITEISEVAFLAELQDYRSLWLFDWQELLPLLSMAWMIGVVYLSAHLLFEMYKVYQLPRHGVIQASDQLQRMFDRLSQQLAVNKATKLVVSMKAEVPMVVGWIRPVVLLPLSMYSGLTTSQLEMLLAHELAHVKRYDYLVNFLQTLVEVTLFFHPCVKWVSKQVRAEREYCCDDVAINHSGNAIAYATALTDAEMLRPHNIPQLAMAASGGSLKKRIFRAVGQHNCARVYTSQWFASMFSFALVVSIFTAGHVVGITDVYDSVTATTENDDNLENGGSLENDNRTIAIESRLTPAGQPVIETKPVKDEQNSADAVLLTKNKLVVSETKVSKNKSLASSKKNENKRRALRQAYAAPKTKIAKLGSSTKKEPNSNGEQLLTNSNNATARTLQEKSPQLGKILQQEKSSHQKHSHQQKKSLQLAKGSQQKNTLQLAKGPQQVLPSQLEKASHKKNKEVIAKVPVSLQKNQKISLATDSKKIDKTLVAIASEINKETPQNAIQNAITESVGKTGPINKTLYKPGHVAPKVIKSIIPNYPSKAINKKLKGEISVTFVVTTKGRVKQITFNNKGHSSFKRSVKKALRKWRFKPGTVNGKATEMHLTKVFDFTKPPEFSIATTGSRIERL